MAQNLKYKILVRDETGSLQDVSKYLSKANVMIGAGSYPTAQMDLNDKNRTVYDMLGYTNSFPLILSGSFDNGNRWMRLFTGSVENVKTIVDDTGNRKTTLLAFGLDSLRDSYLSPNQIAIGNCDYTNLFRGNNVLTYTSGSRVWTETWSTDGYNNYPNGLLYDTKMSLDTTYPVNMNPDGVDFPITLGMGATTKFERINDVITPYALTFYVEENRDLGSMFYLLSNSAYDNWPSASWVDFRLGGNILNYTKDHKLYKKKGGHVVIGSSNPDLFFRFDAGGTESKEAIYVNGEIQSLEAAYLSSKMRKELFEDVPVTVQITTLPTYLNDSDYDIIPIGKRIKIYDTDGSYEQLGLVKLNHEITEDSWITRLDFVDSPPEEAKTMADIKDELKKINEEDSAIMGRAYVRATGGSSTNYAATAERYPVAIGIGGSNATTNKTFGTSTVNSTSVFFRPYCIIPCTGYLSKSGMLHSFATVPVNRGMGLVKEIVLLGNTNSDRSTNRVMETFSWLRPTTFDTTSEEHTVYTSSNCLSSEWPISIEKITLLSSIESCSAYWYKPVSAYSVKTMVDNFGYFSPTSTTWEDAPEMLAQDKMITSKDLQSTPTTYSGMTISAPFNKCAQICFKFRLPLTPESLSRNYLQEVSYNIVGRCSWTDGTNSSIPSATMYFFNTSSNAWALPATTRLSGTSDGKSEYEWGLFGGNTVCKNYINKDSEINVLLYLEDYGEEKGIGTFSIVLNYFDINFAVSERNDDLIYNEGLETYPTVLEKCYWNAIDGSFKTSLPPREILGFWLEKPSAATTNYVNKIADRMAPTKLLPDFTVARKTVNEYKPEWDRMVNIHSMLQEGKDAVSDAWGAWINIFTGDDKNRLKMQEFAWISYSTVRNMTRDPPPIVPLEFLDFVYDTATSNGSRSTLVYNMEYAPAHRFGFSVEYTAVGGGVMSRAILDPSSSVRQGINKNENIALEIQYDFDSTSKVNYTSSYIRPLGGY